MTQICSAYCKECHNLLVHGIEPTAPFNSILAGKCVCIFGACMSGVAAGAGSVHVATCLAGVFGLLGAPCCVVGGITFCLDNSRVTNVAPVQEAMEPVAPTAL